MPEHQQHDSQISASRLGTGESKDVSLNIQHQEFIGRGNVGSVDRVRVKHTKSGRIFTLARKMLERYSQDATKASLEVHKRLQMLPHGREYTLPTFRSTDQGLLMTDLSENKNNLVLSWNDTEAMISSNLDEILLQNPNFNHAFDKVDLVNDGLESELNDKAALIARETADAHIFLGMDCMFAVLTATGEIKLVVSDLDNVNYSPKTDTEQLYYNNLRAAESLAMLIFVTIVRLRRST